MLKLFSKFGAEPTEAESLKLLSIQPEVFENQKVKSETIAIKCSCKAEKRAMDFTLRSEVFNHRGPGKKGTMVR